MSNKNTIFGFCSAGCRYPTMHKDDILEMAKWHIVENNGTEGNYNLSYSKNYKIIDKNKFDYDSEGTYSSVWSFSAKVNVVLTINGKTQTGYANILLPTFDRYIGEVTIKVLDVTNKWDEGLRDWMQYVHVKVNDKVIVLNVVFDTWSNPSETANIEIDFATNPLVITGAKEVYVEGSGTKPVSYTYNFDTLTETDRIKDNDYFVITREDGNTYKVSAITLKNYINGTLEPDAASSAVVGEGEVGKMTIE